MTFFSIFSAVDAQEAIDLSGTWQFAIDRSANGIRPKQYRETIELPGSMLTNISSTRKWRHIANPDK